MSPFARAALIFLGLLIGGAPAQAQEPLKVKPLYCGRGLFDVRRLEDAAKNVSGIDCIAGEKSTFACVAVADKEIGITEFSLKRDQDGDLTCLSGAPLAPERFGCLPGNLDGDREFEGVSLAPDNLIAVTSLAINRGKAKKSKWSLFRDSPGKCEAMGRGALAAFIKNTGSAELEWAIDRTQQCGGLIVEGLERMDGELYFGLRSPGQRAEGIAYIIHAPENAFFSDKPMPAGTAKLDKVKFAGADGKPVAGIGIRGMDAVNGKLILLTGDAGVKGTELALTRSRDKEMGCPDLMKGDEFPNAESGLAPMLWMWTPGAEEAQLIGALGGKFASAAVEGVTVIPGKADGKVDIILAIDDPSKAGLDTQLALIKGIVLP
ncbi:MAG: hypothetical protein JNM20_11045 [Rhizobiales bacterium]|nr:hypothetical protein [Hyphomicrobiales bacterium]